MNVLLLAVVATLGAPAVDVFSVPGSDPGAV